MLENSHRILLVDDDEMDRMSVKRALKKSSMSSFGIIEAKGVDEAIALLKRTHYSCLLLDYHLGGDEGIDLVKEIHSEGLSDAPIVMLSGTEDEVTMLNCLKEGAQDFLLKSDLTSSSLVRSIRYAEERKNITLKMRYLAQHDVLTGLSNRSLFIENVKRAINRSQRTHSIFAVIFIDLDNFKNVNDTLGHEAGDKLLSTIAKRIQSTLRAEDVIARLGGDEFAVLLESLSQEPALIKVAQNILNAIKEPISLDDKMINTTASLGVATYPKSADEVSTLIKCADLAMYKTKQDGRNDYSFYSSDLQILANNYAEFKEDIHAALINNSFELYYQPQVNSLEGTIIGAEALIRWNHPTKGFIPPDQFIPIAESLGMINDIGDWVVNEACNQLGTWLSLYPQIRHYFRLAINISPHQMRQVDLQEKLSTIIERYSIPYGLIELELTETALVDDLDRCTEKLSNMEALGIQFAIDDFGTGFSSFRHLQQLPLHILKIDKSFVDPICFSTKSYEIVKSMIMMSHALEMNVVAEGVETVEQAKLLQDLACDQFQGYYFGKPQPPEDFECLLNTSRYQPRILKTRMANNYSINE